MADTHDIGSFFWFLGHLETSDGTRSALVGRLPSQEVEPPFRQSVATYVRLPFTKRCLVIGQWRDSGITEEEDAFLRATYGSEYVLYESGEFKIDVSSDIDLTNEEVKEQVRRKIANHVSDPSDEWQVIDMLGLT